MSLNGRSGFCENNSFVIPEEILVPSPTFLKFDLLLFFALKDVIVQCKVIVDSL